MCSLVNFEVYFSQKYWKSLYKGLYDFASYDLSSSLECLIICGKQGKNVFYNIKYFTSTEFTQREGHKGKGKKSVVLCKHKHML